MLDGQGSEGGSYLRLEDFFYHATLGLRVMQEKMKKRKVGQKLNTQ